MAVPDTSISKAKGKEKSGRARTRAAIIARFNMREASCDSGSHWKASLQRNRVSGVAIAA